MCSQSNMYTHTSIYIYISHNWFPDQHWLQAVQPQSRLCRPCPSARSVAVFVSLPTRWCPHGNHRKTMENHGKTMENGDFTKNTWGFHGIYS